MSPSEHLDVLIVGAGLSGIGAGCHLQRQLPGQSYAILEGRDDIGGTWDLFRYPGIRSDSDMYTLGYSFRPWTRREGDRRRAVDPELSAGHGARATASTAHPLPAPREARGVVERRTRAGRSRPSAARREPVQLHLQLPLHVQRLLRLRRGLHAGVRRASSASTGASCTRRSGPTTSTTPASASS